MPSPARLLAATLATFGLAACGVTTQSQPQALPASAVPYGLLRSSPPPSAPAQSAQLRGVVYLVRSSRIVRTTTSVPLPGRIDQVVRALLEGVSSAESAAGLRSAIPEGTHLISLDLSGTNANLDLSSTFTSARSSDQILAVAQLVFTATASARVSSVTFSVDGKPIEVPSPGGALTTGPVTPTSYRPLLARSG